MTEISLDKYKEFVMSVMSSKSKSLDELIEVLKNLENQGINAALLNTAAVGLSGETGEFSDLVKKIFFQGKEVDSTTREKLEKELGDVIFYWITGCLALGLDPDSVIKLNVDKLSARYPTGFSVTRSEVRAKNDY